MTRCCICARPGAISALLLLAGCQPGVLNPVGPIGTAERTILIDSLAIMLAIVVPTIVAVLAAGWWFRASNTRAKYLPNWAYSGRVELVVWSVPLMTILLLGGVTWIGSHALDPAEPIVAKDEPVEIQVVSMDWKWLFIYPKEQVALVNQMVIPVGVPVHFSLTSASVMNAFFVPRLGSMIYTMNGMRSELNLMADEAGEFPGLSAHYSGDGFATMHFDVRALPPAAYTSWLRSAIGKGRLDTASYTELMRPEGGVPPRVYQMVEPGLFDRIVSQAIPPSAGPKGQ